jgi:hypothetical protein
MTAGRNRIWVSTGALLLAVSCAVVAAGAATATTAPGYNFPVHAVMTNARISLVSSAKTAQYIQERGAIATFPRGVQVDFIVKNNSSKPLLPALQIVNDADYPNLPPNDRGKKYFTAKRVVAPGKFVEFIVTLEFRGQLLLVQLSHKKPHGKPVKITVD